MIHLPCSYILNYSFTSNGSWERCLLSNPKAERLIKKIDKILELLPRFCLDKHRKNGPILKENPQTPTNTTKYRSPVSSKKIVLWFM